ncbi:MAG: Na+/H+ antiporter NhaA, partial [Myxococcota bacterium]|nr:Na+/H+ antiporter NhaA [Myxococcota bacterium]
HKFNFHFVVNDLFMVLFFGIAAKEVSESFLPGGALSSLSKASMPAVATIGGVLGPGGMFFLLNAVLAPTPSIASPGAVPTATDIAYSWLFAQIIFGRSHPAVTFLLVLAVLDDLIGMLIIAVFYTNEVHIQWLGLVVGAIVICEGMRRMGIKSFWPYLLIGGPMCWFGLHNTGVHAALALVPVIPFMPHGGRDAGLFTEKGGENDHGHGEHGHGDDDEHHGHHNDTMNAFEHFFKPIVDVGLFTFGLANAGVVLSGEAFAGYPTWIILCSLLFGKTFGILFFAFIGTKLGLSLPKPMKLSQVVVLGCVAGIGFTVALFVTTVALTSAPKELADSFAQAGTGDMLKLGALLSFIAGPIALGLSKVIGLERLETKEDLKRAVAAAEAAEA